MMSTMCFEESSFNYAPPPYGFSLRLFSPPRLLLSIPLFLLPCFSPPRTAKLSSHMKVLRRLTRNARLQNTERKTLGHRLHCHYLAKSLLPTTFKIRREKPGT